MKYVSATFLMCLLLSTLLTTGGSAAPDAASAPLPIFGFRDATQQRATETRFLAVPDAKLAREHLRILTQAPHLAGTMPRSVASG